MSSQVARPLQRHGATLEVLFTEAFVSTPGSWRPRRPGTAAAASGCLRTQQLPAASALIAGRSSKSGGPLNGPTIDSIMMPRWPAAANTRGMGASTGFIHSSSWLFWKATSPMHAIVSSRPIRLRRTPILRSGSNTEIAPQPRPLPSRKRRLFWKPLMHCSTNMTARRRGAIGRIVTFSTLPQLNVRFVPRAAET
jgi:hypothetical protein